MSKQAKLEEVHASLLDMIALGLNNVGEEACEALQNDMAQAGLTRSASIVSEFARSDRAADRFKLFSKVLLQVRQLRGTRLEFSRLQPGKFSTVQGMKSIAVDSSIDQYETGDGPLEFFRQEGHRLPGLFLLRSGLELSSPSIGDLTWLLAHGFFRDMAILQLADLSPQMREALGVRLLSCTNRLLKRAGVDILSRLGDRPGAMGALTAALGDESLRSRVAGALVRCREHALPALAQGLGSTDVAVRRESAKVLRKIGDPGSVSALQQCLGDVDAEVRAWVRLALQACGQQERSFLDTNAANREDALLRVYSKVELIKRGRIQPSHLLNELETEGWKIYPIAIPALAELPDAASHLAPLMDEVVSGASLEARRSAFEKLQYLPAEGFRDLFHRVAADPDPNLSRKALSSLARVQGYAALERHLDLSLALGREYTSLDADERAYLFEKVLPFLGEVPDCRFVPYLSGLFEESAFAGEEYEYQYSVRPLLLEFGEPMVPSLERYSRSEHHNISGAARMLLQEMGAARAAPPGASALPRSSPPPSPPGDGRLI